MVRDRSWRRAQRDRAIARAVRHLHENGMAVPRYSWWTPEEMQVAARKNAITPHPCSGHCCGNPRHWFEGVTMQERRAAPIADWE